MCFHSSLALHCLPLSFAFCQCRLKFVYEIKITSHGHTFLCIPPSYTIHHVSTTYARKTHNSLATSVIEQWRNTTPLCCDEKSFQESFCQHKLGSGLDIGQELLKFPSCIKSNFSGTLQPIINYPPQHREITRTTLILLSISRGARL